MEQEGFGSRNFQEKPPLGVRLESFHHKLGPERLGGSDPRRRQKAWLCKRPQVTGSGPAGGPARGRSEGRRAGKGSLKRGEGTDRWTGMASIPARVRQGSGVLFQMPKDVIGRFGDRYDSLNRLYLAISGL